MRASLPPLGVVLLAVLCAGAVRSQEPRGRALVADRQGRPVPGATVVAAGSASLAPPLAVADEAGALTWPACAPCEIRAPGFLPWTGDPIPAVRLHRPSSVEVRVLDDETGKPLAGATIELLAGRGEDPKAAAAPGPAAAPQGPPPLATAKADARGRATFGGLVAGAYRIVAAAAGHAKKSVRVAPALEGTDVVTLALRPTTTLVGRVHAGPEPVAGAEVRAVIASPWMQFRDAARGRGGDDAAASVTSRLRLATDARGELRSDELPSRRRADIVLVAIAPDGRWGIGDIPATSDAGRLPAGGTVRVDVDVAPAATVRGSVRWSDGTPAAGVPVVAELERTDDGPRAGERAYGVDLMPAFDEAGGGPTANTGPDGDFVLLGLPRTRWLIASRPPGRSSGEPIAVDLREEDAGGVDIVLPEGARVAGRVVDASMNPVPAARVTVAILPGAGSGRGSPRGLPELLGTETDDAGRFELAGLLPDGRFGLRVEAEGFAASEQEVAAGADVKVVLSRAGAISGRVVSGATGEPVTRFTVASLEDSQEGAPWQRRRRERSEEIVSADGTFRLGDVPAGRWALRVAAVGHVPRTTDLVDVPAAGEAALGDVVVAEGSRVRGLVVDADTQAPVVGARVSQDDGPFSQARRRFAEAAGMPSDAVGVVTDAEGRFEIEGLAPGATTLTAVHGEYPSRPQHSAHVGLADDAAGQEVEVTIRMEAGGAIAGRVVDGAGSAVAGAWVQAYGPGGGRRGVADPVQSGAGGEFRIAPLEPGAVVVKRVDRVDAGLETEVRKGETTEIVLRETGARLHGRILVGDQPTAARVRLVGASSGGGMRGDPAETYSIDGVAPGSHEIEVSLREAVLDGSMQLRTERVRVVVPDGATDVPQDLVLAPQDQADDVVLEGRVEDEATGAGLSGWLVSARPKSGRVPVSTDSRADGSFSLVLREEGAHVVTARLRGRPDVAQSWQPPPDALVVVEGGLANPSPLVLAAKRRAEIRVRVLDAWNQPVQGARCSLVSREQNKAPDGTIRFTQSPAWTDNLGFATATADRTGPHDLLVVVPAKAVVIVPRIEVGSLDELPVILPRAGSLRVVGAESAVLVDQQSGGGWAFRVGRGGTLPIADAAAGEIAIHGLAPGRWALRIGARTVLAEVEPGVETVVDASTPGG